ncbi:hypothetical protein HDU97_000099 [Phlyctochytrium planicorne]|nr:hypothetical protein HDU97_000099 [Phlyctochytrium planicorne]
MRLNGLSQSETATYMAKIFNVKSVSEEISERVWKSTNGNTLQTAMICQALKAAPQIFSMGQETLIIIDQKTIAAVSNDSATVLHIGISLDDLQDIMKDKDYFGFLDIPEDDGINYSFRHIRIMHAIYESIPLAERVRVHTVLAEHYEAMAESDPGQKASLLPAICHHYSKSNNRVRTVAIAEQLGDSLMDAHIMVPAFRAYGKALDALAASASDPFNRQAQSRILSKSAYCMTFSVQYLEEGTKLALESLKLAGDVLNLAQAKNEISKELKRLLSLWMKTKGGRKENLWSSQTMDYYASSKQAYSALTLAAFYDTVMPEEVKLLIITKSLQHGLAMCESDPDNLYGQLVLLVVGICQKPSKTSLALARYLSKQASRILERGSGMEVDFISAHIYLRSFLFDHVDKNDYMILLEGVRGGKLGSVDPTRIYAFLWIMDAWKGCLDTPSYLDYPFFSELARENPVWAVTALYGALFCHFLRSENTRFTAHLVAFKDARKNIPQKLLGLVQFFDEIFDVMKLILLPEGDEAIVKAIRGACSSPEKHLLRQAEMAVVMAITLTLVVGQDNTSKHVKQEVLMAVDKLMPTFELLRSHSNWGEFANLIWVSLQNNLRGKPPPGRLKKMAYARRGLFSRQGNYRFLGLFANAMLIMHFPTRNVSQQRYQVADEFRRCNASLLELWVRDTMRL